LDPHLLYVTDSVRTIRHTHLSEDAKPHLQHRGLGWRRSDSAYAATMLRPSRKVETLGCKVGQKWTVDCQESHHASFRLVGPKRTSRHWLDAGLDGWIR